MITIDRQICRYNGMRQYFTGKGASMYILLAPFLLLACGKNKDNTPAKARRHMLVVMDASHGGADLGNVNNAGLSERDLVLGVCERMKDLAGEYNIEIALTRTDSNGMSAEDRIAITDPLNADAVISLHINKSSATKVIDAYEMIVSPTNAELNNSRLLASHIVTHLLWSDHVSKVTEKNVHILTNNKHPAVAIECGDISNDKDVATLTTDVDNWCRHMLDALVSYGNSMP